MAEVTVVAMEAVIQDMAVVDGDTSDTDMAAQVVDMEADGEAMVDSVVDGEDMVDQVADGEDMVDLVVDSGDMADWAVDWEVMED